MQHLRYAVAAIVLVSCGLFLRPSIAAQSPVARDFLITNVRLFDGVSVLPLAQVAVAGGTIRAVGADLPQWRRLPLVDGMGATLLPGLIDAHAHVRNEEDLRQALRFGVTTVLDMGATVDPVRLFALRKTASESSDMADVRLASFFAGAPRGNVTRPDPRITVIVPPVGSPEDAKEFVADRHTEGADYLKILLTGVRTARTGVSNLERATVRALVDSAHAHGMLAVAHIESLEDVDIALSARIDGLMHVWREGGPNPGIARRLADGGVFVVPTLDVFDGGLSEGRMSLLADSRFQPVISDGLREQLTRFAAPAGVNPDLLRTTLASEVAAVKNLREMGVRLLAGSDADTPNPTAHGISLHRELELFAAAGLNAAEILSAATAKTADAFRLADRGRIMAGRRADLVLVRGDPTSDVLVTRDILRVWKAGVPVDRIVRHHD
jgi:imidazolonepropionase-like amidohydrolase